MGESLAYNLSTALVLGLIIGSFLNVCIHRLPRNESLITPSSRCPSCQHPVRWWDNIPVVSFLILGGRCRDCGRSISWRYPVIEFVNGIAYVLLVWRFGIGGPAFVYGVLFSALLVITFIDLDHQIIPDRITLPGMVVGLVASAVILPIGIWDAVIGLLLGGALFYGVAVASGGGMGGGDIKLIAMIGAFLGWKEALLTIFIGALAGSAIGLFLMAFKGKSRKYPVPFGPFLSLGAVISLFAGQAIWNWYQHLGAF
ncbi:MAG TPA: prepilin peptidase [Nitrospiria bacterium]|jgi:leader peptidase (prepilin peptidase)/N-methyltransferase|nr:prepilin peptidase [Nitrospiria bacterium]